MSALGDWIRDDIRRRQERWHREIRAEAFATNLQRVLEKTSCEGYLAVIQEAYNLGCVDRLDQETAQAGRQGFT